MNVSTDEYVIPTRRLRINWEAVGVWAFAFAVFGLEVYGIYRAARG